MEQSTSAHGSDTLRRPIAAFLSISAKKFKVGTTNVMIERPASFEAYVAPAKKMEHIVHYWAHPPPIVVVQNFYRGGRKLK